ncbi:hypothetical protein SAMN04488005_1089 [Yoonia tamlensis]|uniref:Uncharacterized protein n=1 Tax=Yoonia tamlensis TaxID=390270 RepID=A0A1I6G4X8_9RHOB|nr:hypothetical protein [Yoonia tamlensis]SFR37255.1 hypothetical protein SAMN04488005_1089 [Yoonia tamlensis]
MAGQKLGVVVIHGVWSQAGSKPADPVQPTYSRGMAQRVMRKLGKRAEDIIWKEVSWADILQPRQREYLELIRDKTGSEPARAFVLSALSDVASYRKVSDGSTAIYEQIHSRVEQTMRALAAQIGPNGPVLILAHSLGAHIMSNYIYDVQNFMRLTGDHRFDCALENMQTVAGFMTFGCNIPVFLFAHRRNSIVPINYPGSALADHQQISPWWQNFYDKQDVLAYPMGPAAPCYSKMVVDRQLRDVPMHLGKPVAKHWDPTTHGDYWDDPEMIAPVVHYINKFFNAKPTPSA